MLDRGNLKVPSDRATQWTFFSYVMFVIVKDKVCQKSLSDLLLEISTIYDFGMSKSHAKSLANRLQGSKPESSKVVVCLIFSCK